MPSTIDSLYVSLGLSIDEFERDFLAAEKSAYNHAKVLKGLMKNEQLKMNIDMAGFDNATNSLAGLTSQLNHLQSMLKIQSKVADETSIAYTAALKRQEVLTNTVNTATANGVKVTKETQKEYGKVSNSIGKLETRLLTERAAQASLESQIRQTSAAQKELIATNKASIQMSGAMSGALTIAGIAIAAFMQKSAKAAINAVESENLFMESLGDSALEARIWSTQVSNALGLNDYETRKSLGTFYVMTKSMGLTADKALELSTNMTELAYDIASLYNISTEDAFTKLRSGLVGQVRPLRELGITVDEETIKSYAYRTGLVQVGEALTVQEKILARYGAILEQTGVAQGDMARTLDSPANLIRRLTSDIQKLEIELGQNMLPIIKDVMQVLKGTFGTIQDKNIFQSLAGDILVVGGSAIAAKGSLTLLARGMGFLSPALATATIAFAPYAAAIIATVIAGQKLGTWMREQVDDREVRWNHAIKQNITMLERRKQLIAEYAAKGVKLDPVQLKETLYYEFNEEAYKQMMAKAAAKQKAEQKKAEQIAMESAVKIQEETVKVYDEIAKIKGTTYEKEIRDITKTTEAYRKAGVDKQTIAEYFYTATAEAQRKAAEERQKTLASMYGTELDRTLISIDQQKQAYIKAGFSELESRVMIEKKKFEAVKSYAEQTANAMRSALTGGWGTVIDAVKEALKNGENAYTAMEEALKKQKKDFSIEQKAIDMVGSKVGLSDMEIQMSMPRSPMYELGKAREMLSPSTTDAFTRAVNKLEVIGNTIRQVPAESTPERNINLQLKVEVTGAQGDDLTTANRVANIIQNRLTPMLKDNYAY